MIMYEEVRPEGTSFWEGWWTITLTKNEEQKHDAQRQRQQDGGAAATHAVKGYSKQGDCPQWTSSGSCLRRETRSVKHEDTKNDKRKGAVKQEKDSGTHGRIREHCSSPDQTDTPQQDEETVLNDVKGKDSSNQEEDKEKHRRDRELSTSTLRDSSAGKGNSPERCESLLQEGDALPSYKQRCNKDNNYDFCHHPPCIVCKRGHCN